ncbi:MAG: hypothetical protein P1V97_19575 [Planctomycetota bacterium]|nr:hypothetical protein [Planctomycetota bacterium]
MEVSVTRSASHSWRCVYCHDTIYQAPVICPLCKTLMHKECCEELGRCPTFGCEGDPLFIYREGATDDLELESLGRDFRSVTKGTILGAIVVALLLAGVAGLVLFTP